MINRTLDFVTKLLKNTMKLDMHHFTKPYTNLSAFDHFLRESLEHAEELYGQIHDFVNHMSHSTFHMIKDSYELNYVLFFPFEDKKDLITIGPYLSEPIDEKYWHEITKHHNLTISNIQNLKGFIYGIPIIISNLNIISIISDLITYMNPDSSPFMVQYHDLSRVSKPDQLFQPKNDFEAYSKKVEDRYNIERELLGHIARGNGQAALESARRFVSAPFEPRLKSNLREVKSLLITANTLFRKAVEPNELHPIHLHEITSKFVHLIENATSETALERIYEKMIREYCLLVKTKSAKQYSHCVRQTLYFIEFNLDTKINLTELALKHNVSAPYLSSLFKKEVGTTIVKYVNKQRIDRAVNLLNRSSLSIQDVAIYVGIYDQNYFTKVFKKEVGMSPSDYKNKLHMARKKSPEV